MKECDPDWTTSLNLDHAGVKAVGPAKFDLLRGTGKTLKQRQATSPLPTSSGSDMDDEAMFPAGLKIESQRLEANGERYKRKRRRPGPCDTPEQEEEYSMDHCSDVLKLVVIEEELPAEEQNQSPTLAQEDQKPPQIKVEQEDQKPPQIKEEKEDTEIMQFTFDSVTVKIEDHEEKPHIPDLLYSQPVENTEFVGTNQCLESDDEDKTCNSSSETDVSDGHCEESEAQPATDPSAVCKQRWPHANRSNETMAGSRGLIKHASALSAKGGVAYFKKLTLTNGKRLRDPRKITVWKDDMKTWPNIQWSDIYTYLVEKTHMYTREELRAYKSLDAYDYMIGGHLKKVTYHDLDSEFCVLKSESKQQKTTTYNAWVIINKADNYILSADCTCMAGHGYCCSHVAAILFKIELCVRMGETGKAEVASGVCTLKDSSKEVQPAPLREISFHRSKQLKRRLPGTSKIGPNRVALRVLTLDDILELHAVEPDAAVLTSLDSSDTDTASSGEHDESDDDSDDDSDDTNEEQTD